MLLSGPPSALIVFEPGIQVNPVVHATAPELDARHPQLGQQRDADPEIECRLLLAEDSCFRQPQGMGGQVMLVRHCDADLQRGDFPPVLLDGGKRHVPGRPAASPSGRPGRELSSHPEVGGRLLNPASLDERQRAATWRLHKTTVKPQDGA